MLCLVENPSMTPWRCESSVCMTWHPQIQPPVDCVVLQYLLLKKNPGKSRPCSSNWCYSRVKCTLNLEGRTFPIRSGCNQLFLCQVIPSITSILGNLSHFLNQRNSPHSWIKESSKLLGLALKGFNTTRTLLKWICQLQLRFSAWTPEIPRLGSTFKVFEATHSKKCIL